MVALNIRQLENIKQNYHQNVDNIVIGGYFEKYLLKKETAISKVNKTLQILLGILVVITLISYYYAVSTDVKLNIIRKDIVSITEENVELQNKIDYLSSFYNVDKSVKNANLLQTAKSVLEVDVKTPSKSIKTQKNKRCVSKIPSKKYKWSIGY